LAFDYSGVLEGNLRYIFYILSYENLTKVYNTKDNSKVDEEKKKSFEK
jgi:hypothetical protein